MPLLHVLLLLLPACGDEAANERLVGAACTTET